MRLSIMGWAAYPWKNGQVLSGVPHLHAGRYAQQLEQVSGINAYYQPDPPEEGEEETPSVDFEGVKLILEDFEETGEFDEVRAFLKWCVENECGIWFSF